MTQPKLAYLIDEDIALRSQDILQKLTCGQQADQADTNTLYYLLEMLRDQTARQEMILHL